jgi:hypothetical protein
MKPAVISGIAFLLLTAIAHADTIAVSRFESDGLAGWERKSFRGETEYSLVRDGESTVVRAHSKATASGIYRKVALDTLQYRYLRWKWKVKEPLPGNGLEKTKAGDDYSARMYVVFPGFFFWQTKAINYVWAGRLPREESFPNPYTRNAMMVVVESGADKAGTWVTEQRDILSDYRRLFGGEPRKLGAIAIMTDSDNTGGSATAWYGDITLSSTPAPEK